MSQHVDGFPVAAACRVLGVSRSGYYEQLDRPPSARAVADEALTKTILEAWSSSRETYGAPRVCAELRLGLGVSVGRKRVARLMREAGIAGVCHKRKRGGRRPDPAVFEDLVKRQFRADGPNELWATDVTQHRAGDGWVYCAVVLDAWSRKVVGWPVADHMRTELVADALQMAVWRRKPHATVVHSDRGSQYTSWVFGRRLREAGLLGSMGRVASSVDNTMVESFWSIMRRELLDRADWATKDELASSIFEWIEAFYNPTRRHTSLGNRSPAEYEALAATQSVA